MNCSYIYQNLKTERHHVHLYIYAILPYIYAVLDHLYKLLRQTKKTTHFSSKYAHGIWYRHWVKYKNIHRNDSGY